MTQMNLVSALPEIFDKSVESAFRDCIPEGDWSFSPLAEDPETMDEAVFLTISSHLFRIFISIHFHIDDRCKHFISTALKDNKGALELDTINDYLCEVGNAVCGGFKRDLGKSIPALGMSTPNILQQGCFNYIKDLNVEHEKILLVKYEGNDLFYASYYFCKHGDLDFDVDVSEDEADAGELELF